PGLRRRLVSLRPMALDLADDRKARNRRAQAELVRAAALPLAVVPVVLAVLAGVLARNVLVALLVLVVAAAAVALSGWWAVEGYGGGLLARPGSAPLGEAAAPRLHNPLEGLCAAHGVAKPAVLGTPGPGANVAAVTSGWGASASTALVVPTPLLDS